MRKIDLIGQKFGSLEVISQAPHQGSNIAWLCRCVCGSEKAFMGCNLTSKKTQSCGCLRISKNMLSYHKLYDIWRGLIRRCHDTEDKRYKDYGGRGIKVCERWQGPEGLKNFIADMGDRPEGTTLDRKDNSQGYYPENCRWATTLEQQNNKRNNAHIEFQGKRLTVQQWARELGISRGAIDGRLAFGWPLEKVLCSFDFRRRY